MAMQICPKCKSDSFTWNIHNEESTLTKWSCINCKYTAFENESDERKCLKCNQKTETKLKDKIETKLKDKIEEFWWCSNCNTTTEIE